MNAIEQAMKRAFQLGQTYWMQADSESWSENKKAEDTQAKFNALLAETITALQSMQGEAVALSDYQHAASVINTIYGAAQHCDCSCFELAEQWRNETHGGTLYTHPQSPAVAEKAPPILDEIVKNDERYRWLRDADMFGEGSGWDDLCELSMSAFDEWIDAAMLASKSGKGE